MSFIDLIRRIERIDQLIRLRATGRPSELAQKLGISESQLYEVLSIMKVELGGSILYSKTLQSYYYPKNIKFKCAFEEISGTNIKSN
jgi:predicted DNA-binding transcriptional regulator AlpA